MATNVEDVVVYRVEGREVQGWGRDTLATAQEFCRRPKWPAKLSDHFVAVDDWGYGKIVAATPSLENWVGTSIAQFRREVH